MTIIVYWLTSLEIPRIGFGLVRIRNTNDSSRSPERDEMGSLRRSNHDELAKAQPMSIPKPIHNGR